MRYIGTCFSRSLNINVWSEMGLFTVHTCSKVKVQSSKVKVQRSKVKGQRSKVKGQRSKVKGQLKIITWAKNSTFFTTLLWVPLYSLFQQYFVRCTSESVAWVWPRETRIPVSTQPWIASIEPSSSGARVMIETFFKPGPYISFTLLNPSVGDLDTLLCLDKNIKIFYFKHFYFKIRWWWWTKPL